MPSFLKSHTRPKANLPTEPAVKVGSTSLVRSKGTLHA